MNIIENYRNKLFFKKYGYLYVNLNLEDNFIDKIINSTTPLYDKHHLEVRHNGTRVQDAWKYISQVRSLAIHGKILRTLKVLYGREPKPFQTLNFPFGTSQRVHSDTIHFSSIPRGYMAGVWVALEKIDENNGPLVYYPKSHKLPYYNLDNLDINKNNNEKYKIYEEKIFEMVNQKCLIKNLGIMQKGTAIIWHANLLHGGLKVKDKTRTRHSQVTHYYFENCKYFTPLNSSGSEICWREPEWIA